MNGVNNGLYDGLNNGLQNGLFDGLNNGLENGLNGEISGKRGEPLLLNKFSNAAAAFSLRKLRSNYLGYCIKVRRSSDNTTLDIGFNESNELDITSLKIFIQNNSAYVNTWYDQSGNSRNAVQNTNANQPRIILNGSIDTLNSKAALYFEDFYLTNSTISVYTVLNVLTNINVIYDFGTPLGIGSVTSGSFYFPFRENSTTSEIQFRALGANSRTYNTGINFNSRQQLMASNDSGSNIIIHKNNNLILSNTSSLGSFSESSGFSIGYPIGSTSGRLNGYINEIIIWNNNQSTNRTNIQRDINNYYNIY
jgi:hypothetical protein